MRKLTLISLTIAASFVVCGSCLATEVNVTLCPIGDVTTWPDTPFRWKDIADNLYATSYMDSFDYGSPLVTVSFYETGGTFAGSITGEGLKPNFAYQMKLVGKPESDTLWGDTGDDWSNEQIGYTGRWWRKQPNPGNTNDADYETHKDDPNYIFEGYLLFSYFVTDENGDIAQDFYLDSSFHVLWKTSQRAPSANDSDPTTHTLDSFIPPAYDQSYDSTEVSLYAEWESGRALPGEATLTPGAYDVRFILTEESFHQSGLGGYWAAALGGNPVQFAVIDPVGGTMVGEDITKRVGSFTSSPNPFTPHTMISYYLPDATHVQLKIYDASGGLVRVLEESTFRGAGRHSICWDGSDDSGCQLPSGVYFCRMQAGSRAETGRVVLLR
jgi:hypothetical protein